MEILHADSQHNYMETSHISQFTATCKLYTYHNYMYTVYTDQKYMRSQLSVYTDKKYTQIHTCTFTHLR
jgi:hypothetical protein